VYTHNSAVELLQYNVSSGYIDTLVTLRAQQREPVNNSGDEGADGGERPYPFPGLFCGNLHPTPFLHVRKQADHLKLGSEHIPSGATDGGELDCILVIEMLVGCDERIGLYHLESKRMFLLTDLNSILLPTVQSPGRVSRNREAVGGSVLLHDVLQVDGSEDRDQEVVGVDRTDGDERPTGCGPPSASPPSSGYILFEASNPITPAVLGTVKIDVNALFRELVYGRSSGAQPVEGRSDAYSNTISKEYGCEVSYASVLDHPTIFQLYSDQSRATRKFTRPIKSSLATLPSVTTTITAGGQATGRETRHPPSSTNLEPNGPERSSPDALAAAEGGKGNETSPCGAVDWDFGLTDSSSLHWKVIELKVSDSGGASVAEVEASGGEERGGTNGESTTHTLRSILLYPKNPSPSERDSSQSDGAQASDRNPSAPMRLIVVPHGGPHACFSSSYYSSYAFLATACNAGVLLVNYRGSTGFGQDSLDSLPGHIGFKDVQDVHGFTQYALNLLAEPGDMDTKSERGNSDTTGEHGGDQSRLLTSSSYLFDRNRVAIVGGSHGGFLSAHMIGQFPDLYKVACMRNPVFELISMFYTSDIPDWILTEIGLYHPHHERSEKEPGVGEVETNRVNDAQGRPEVTAKSREFSFIDDITPETRLKMSSHSPSNYARNIRAPTLLLLGSKDRRVPPSQGLALHHILQER